MNNVTHKTHWSTSSHGGAPAPLPAELSELKKQLDECSESRLRFSLQCMADSLNGVVTRRLVAIVSITIVFLAIGYLIANA